MYYTGRKKIFCPAKIFGLMRVDSSEQTISGGCANRDIAMCIDKCNTRFSQLVNIWCFHSFMSCKCTFVIVQIFSNEKNHIGFFSLTDCFLSDFVDSRHPLNPHIRIDNIKITSFMFFYFNFKRGYLESVHKVLDF